MNCIWIILFLLLCNNNNCCGRSKDTSDCGCDRNRDMSDCGCDRNRDSSDYERERKKEDHNCGCFEPRHRSAFDDREDNECPCKREYDYYQAERKEDAYEDSHE